MMSKQRLHQLFWKYTEHELSPAEEVEFLQLLADPQWSDELQTLGTLLWEQTEQQGADHAGRERIRRILNRVKPSKIRALNHWLRVASACAVIVAVPYFWYMLAGRQATQAIVKIHEISTGYGQKKTITLPDKSVIYLNAGSSIRYQDDYNEMKREVTLTGEAFFQVTSNEKKPFKIYHQQLYTEVLGTSFNIRAFQDDPEMQVSVATGSVRVSHAADSAGPSRNYGTLTSGQQLTFNKANGKPVIKSIKDIETRSSWKEVTLVFRNQRFDDVANMLVRWYNVKVHFERDNLKNCRFTASFNNLPINSVLELLKQSSTFTYRIAGRDIYIKGAGCD